MEINRENFDAVFPKIQHLLTTCEFYSFDLEMTGINPVRFGRGIDTESIDVSKLPYQCRFLSTPSDSFASKWEAASTFSPMQIGLSIFHKRTPDDAVTNFKKKLTCQESRELVEQWERTGNDTDKLVAEVNSLRGRAKQSCLSLEAAVSAASDDDNSSLAPSLSLATLEQISRLTAFANELEDVEEFAKNHKPVGGACEDYVASTFHAHLFPSYHFGDGELKMSIETVGDFLATHNMDFNAWVRNSLLYAPREAIARKRLTTLLAEKPGTKGFDQNLLAKVPPKQVNIVTTLFALMENFAAENASSPDARRTKAVPYVDEDALRALHAKAKSLGLRIVKGDIVWGNDVRSPHSETATFQGTLLFEAMFNCKRPVVVHNSWSDLLFLYRAAHSTPLKSYEEFKTNIQQLFPVLYDTRTMSSLDIMQPFGNVRGALDKTYELFKKQCEAVTVRVTLSDGFAEGANAAHNAGYDAFITGSLFLYTRGELRKHNMTVEPFKGVIPVYASIFSIALNDVSHDLLIQTPDAPILWAIPDGIRGPMFSDRVAAILAKNNLQSVVMNCGDSCVCYVTGTAKHTGSLLDSALAKVQTEMRASVGQRSKIINLDVDKFLAASGGKIRFLDIHAM